ISPEGKSTPLHASGPLSLTRRPRLLPPFSSLTSLSAAAPEPAAEFPSGRLALILVNAIAVLLRAGGGQGLAGASRHGPGGCTAAPGWPSSHPMDGPAGRDPQDHPDRINWLPSDVYTLRGRFRQLRAAHFDFRALYRRVQQARHQGAGPAAPSNVRPLS